MIALDLNLGAARATAESTMTDRCTIARDGPGRHDDVFDEQTMAYSSPVSDAATVYTGRCTCSSLNQRGQGAQREGGQDVYVDAWQIKVPATATPAIGDVVTITSSTWDPQLVGQEFTVVEVRGGTRAVTRTLRCVTRTRGPRT